MSFFLRDELDIPRVTVFSYGGGVQSTAALVLAAQQRIPFKTFMFANVGDRAEHPETIKYYHQHAVPFAKEHGLELLMIRRVMRQGAREGQVNDLYDECMTGDVPIPMRSKTGAFGHRNCTPRWKIEPIAREVRKRGASVERPALIGIGISVDEIERAHPGIDPRQPFEELTYPLLDLGLRRDDCEKVILDAGLPVPHKSACWFCPFHSKASWARLRSEEPELFERACAMEEGINARRTTQPVFLSRYGRPLREVALTFTPEDEAVEGCDKGWCMT